MPMHISPSTDTDLGRAETMLPRIGPITNPLPPATQADVLGILQREQDRAIALLSSSPLLTSLFVSYANQAAALESASATPSPESEEWKTLQNAIVTLQKELEKLESANLEVTNGLEAAEASREAFRSQVSSLKEVNTTRENDIKSLGAELAEAKENYDRLMVDSNAEKAALQIRVLDLEAQRGELKEAIVEQQIKISKLGRQGSSDPPNSPAAAIPTNAAHTHGLNTPEDINVVESEPSILSTVGRKKLKAQREKERKEKEAREKKEREERDRAEREEREEKERREKAELQARRKECEERERKEREERTEKERIEREAHDQTEREAKERAERDVREQAEKSAREKMDRNARKKAEREAARKAEQEAKEREARERAEEEARVKAERDAKRKAAKEAREQAVREAREKADRMAKEKEEREEKEMKERHEREMKERYEREVREKIEGEEKEKAEREAKEKADREAKEREEEEKKKVPASKIPFAWGSTVGKNDRSRKTSGLPQKEQKNEWASSWDFGSAEQDEHSGLPPIITSSVPGGIFSGAGNLGDFFTTGKNDSPGGAEEVEIRTPSTKNGIDNFPNLSKVATPTEPVGPGRLDLLEDLNTSNMSARVSVSSENERLTDAEKGPSPTQPTHPSLASEITPEVLPSTTSELLETPKDVQREVPMTPQFWPAPPHAPIHQAQATPKPLLAHPVQAPALDLAPAETKPEKPLSLWERKKLKAKTQPAPASSLFGGGDSANSPGVWGETAGGVGNTESIVMPTLVGDRQSIFTDTPRDQKRENQRDNLMEGFLGSNPARRNDSAQSQMTAKPVTRPSGWGSWGASLLDPPGGFTPNQPPKSQPAGFGLVNKPAWGAGRTGDNNA